MSEETNTEKEVPEVAAAPAGGNDPHRDAERAKESSEDGEGQPVTQPEEEKVADDHDDAVNTAAPAEQTPEEKEAAELAAQEALMVDYILVEGDLETFAPEAQEKMKADGVVVGTTIKLAPSHPLLNKEV